MTKPHIVIIGAGLAGLTAAWRLQSMGVEPVVFEAEKIPGGRCRSVTVEDCIFDLGAWTFPVDSPVHSLTLELGLSQDLVEIPVTVGRPRKGRLRVGNMCRPTSLIGTVCSYREMPYAVLLMGLARKTPGSSPDEAASVWAKRHFPRTFIDDLLNPIANLFFLQDLSTLSRDEFLNTIGYLSSIKLHSFKSGMGFLTSSMAKRIPLKTEASVENLKMSDEEIIVLGKGLRQKADGVIIATPLPAALNLIGDYLESNAQNAAAGWNYASILLAHLMLSKKLSKRALQVLPARGKSRIACGLTIERAKNRERVESRHEAMTMYARPDRVENLMRMSDKDVAKAFSGELFDWMGIDEQHVAVQGIHRWKYAAAWSDPDMASRLDALTRGLERLAAEFPVWLAGDYLGTSSLSGAVTSAEESAEACISYLTRAGKLI